jgi:hypothetical protein
MIYMLLFSVGKSNIYCFCYMPTLVWTRILQFMEDSEYLNNGMTMDSLFETKRTLSQ